MWFLDGCAASDVIAAGRLEPIPYEEWLKLDNQLEGAGPTAERLWEQLEVAAEDAAPPKPRSES